MKRGGCTFGDGNTDQGLAVAQIRSKCDIVDRGGTSFITLNPNASSDDLNIYNYILGTHLEKRPEADGMVVETAYVGCHGAGGRCRCRRGDRRARYGLQPRPRAPYTHRSGCRYGHRGH